MIRLLIIFMTLFNVLSLYSLENQDIELEGERWITRYNGYLCQAFGSEVQAPKSHEKYKMKFQSLTTDYTLDNVLLKASFSENGVECRYSAILFANNAARTIYLVRSKAYSSSGESCLEGKALLDEQLSFENNYLYYGRPHHAAIMIPTESASEICGEGKTHMGIDFILVGRKQ